MHEAIRDATARDVESDSGALIPRSMVARRESWRRETAVRAAGERREAPLTK